MQMISEIDESSRGNRGVHFFDENLVVSDKYADEPLEESGGPKRLQLRQRFDIDNRGLCERRTASGARISFGRGDDRPHATTDKLLDAFQQAHGLDRLGQECVGASLQAFATCVRRDIGRQDNDGDALEPASHEADHLQRLDATHAPHIAVEQNNVVSCPPKCFQYLVTI